MCICINGYAHLGSQGPFPQAANLQTEGAELSSMIMSDPRYNQSRESLLAWPGTAVRPSIRLARTVTRRLSTAVRVEVSSCNQHGRSKDYP